MNNLFKVSFTVNGKSGTKRMNLPRIPAVGENIYFYWDGDDDIDRDAFGAVPYTVESVTCHFTLENDPNECPYYNEVTEANYDITLDSWL